MSRPRIQENLTKEVTAWSNGKFNLQEKKKMKKAAMKYSKRAMKILSKKSTNSKEKNYTFQTE